MAETQEENEAIADESMTEQIEATYGPVTVYVSGTDSEDTYETFEKVWETMSEYSEDMMDRRESMDANDSGTNSRTFG